MSHEFAEADQVEEAADDTAAAAAAAVESGEPLRLVVAPDESGQRLDQFLVAHLPDFSRARLKRLIEDGEVAVEDRIQKPAYAVRAGERVEVNFPEAASPSLIQLTPENISLEIIYEDDDLVVVNKPAGLVVHPGAGVKSGTLANGLAFHFRELSPCGGTERPGIVHRLDRDTSGLLVVAKNEFTHERLGDQFRLREVFKSYTALVYGRVPDDRGQIDKPLGRDPVKRTRMAVVPVGGGGRPALSLYRVKRRFTRFTLLAVEIKTGRTHQIRVHLAWLKHPVVGDKTYGRGRDEVVPDAVVRARIKALERHFLHAAELGFRHPRTKAQLHFTAQLPAVLADFLNLDAQL